MSQNKLEGHEVFVELVSGIGAELPLSAEYVAQAVQDVLVVTGWKYGDPIPSDSLFMEEILENNPALITNQGARNILRTMFAYVSVLTKNLEFVAQVTDRQAGLSMLFDSQCRLKQSRLGIPRAIFPSIPHSFKLKGSDEPREVSMKQDIEKASSGDLTPEQANQEADAAELRLHASQDPVSEKSYPEVDLRATPAEMRLNRVWLEFEKAALDAAIKGIPMTVLERVLIASAPEWIDSTQLTSVVNAAVELYAERLIRMPVFDEFTYAMFDEISLLDLAEKFNMDIREVRVKYADWKNHCDSWGNSKFNNLMLILIRI